MLASQLFHSLSLSLVARGDHNISMHIIGRHSHLWYIYGHLISIEGHAMIETERISDSVDALSCQSKFTSYELRCHLPDD